MRCWPVLAILMDLKSIPLAVRRPPSLKPARYASIFVALEELPSGSFFF